VALRPSTAATPTFQQSQPHRRRTLQLITNPLNVGGTLTTSAGTFDANTLAVTAAGLTTV